MKATLLISLVVAAIFAVMWVYAIIILKRDQK